MSVRLTKEPKQRLRFLEPEEEDRLLAKCKEPLRTMVAIGMYCGVRLKSEGLTLRWQDIDFRVKTLTAQAAYSKNSKPRTIPMNSLVLAALPAPGESEWVFTKANGTRILPSRDFSSPRTIIGLLVGSSEYGGVTERPNVPVMKIFQCARANPAKTLNPL